MLSAKCRERRTRMILRVARSGLFAKSPSQYRTSPHPLPRYSQKRVDKTMKVADPVRDDRLLGGNLVPLHPCAGKSKAMGRGAMRDCRRVEPAATLLELAGNARTRNGRPHIRG